MYAELRHITHNTVVHHPTDNQLFTCAGIVAIQQLTGEGVVSLTCHDRSRKAAPESTWLHLQVKAATCTSSSDKRVILSCRQTKVFLRLD